MIYIIYIRLIFKRKVEENWGSPVVKWELTARIGINDVKQIQNTEETIEVITRHENHEIVELN